MSPHIIDAGITSYSLVARGTIIVGRPWAKSPHIANAGTSFIFVGCSTGTRTAVRHATAHHNRRYHFIFVGCLRDALLLDSVIGRAASEQINVSLLALTGGSAQPKCIAEFRKTCKTTKKEILNISLVLKADPGLRPDLRPLWHVVFHRKTNMSKSSINPSRHVATTLRPDWV